MAVKGNWSPLRGKTVVIDGSVVIVFLQIWTTD